MEAPESRNPYAAVYGTVGCNAIGVIRAAALDDADVVLCRASSSPAMAVASTRTPARPSPLSILLIPSSKQRH
uniref:Uncharacterized protein n=1 Tax=Arundo donax TaxID=35708 RepID=A0A0A9GU38_ARUDO